MKPIDINLNLLGSRAARWLVTAVASAALVSACGGETAEMPGTMEPADTANETAATDPESETMPETSAETSAETGGESRMDGPPASAMTGTMPEGGAQESPEADASTESMPSGEEGDDGRMTGEPLPASGVPVWAEGAAGELVPGLDGAEYDAYAPGVIGRVQEALSEEGLYTGPINQVLDQPTMNAIGEFQEAHGIHASGVPSPITREELFEENG